MGPQFMSKMVHKPPNSLRYPCFLVGPENKKARKQKVLIEKGPPVLSLQSKELENRNDELDPWVLIQTLIPRM
jgi:hypothetical protein